MGAKLFKIQFIISVKVAKFPVTKLYNQGIWFNHVKVYPRLFG